jgi:MerR family transcriptional regulator, light-induced transcriptional regulator
MLRNSAGMSIGTVADQTGLSVPVLRSWEQRHGFPTATRTATGHRRYTAQDVDDILQVLRERETGLSLEAAIERTRNRGASRPARSLYADLRAASPHLTPYVLSKRSMLAISRAIEDEFCARAERPLLIGCFQRADLYQRSARRWQSLADTAAAAVVIADFASDSPPTSRPIELGLDANPPLQREWAIVCDAPDAAACLVGWEHPRAGPISDDDRMFEAIWTAEPVIVRHASRIALDLVTRQAPHLAALASHLVPLDAFEPTSVIRRATDLTNRIIAYLDR